MRKLNVNTAMSRPSKATPQAKRVTPPAVPSSTENHRSSIGGGGGGGGFGTITTGSTNIGTDFQNYSSLEDGGFTQTRESPAALNEIIDYTTTDSTTNIITKSPINLNPYVTPTTALTFPIPGRGEPLTHKAAVFYHQQLALQEDQGIDLTQSPGRDSPGSSSGSAGSGSRHSTASLDSGRASSYITSGGGSSTASTRGGGSNSSTGGGGGGSGGGGGGGSGSGSNALSSPRCSVSSCSIGSCDRMNQRTENDIILDWLNDIKFDEYTQLFISAGYDLSTITRMTPEDLTAIGIKNPHHRERLKQHIDHLQITDGLPNFVPGSIEEWLRLLRLDEYVQPLLDQNYKTVRDVTQVTWEDLEDIGIVKLGHQKKILLAIKRVKDIISGKWNLKCDNSINQHQPQSPSTQKYHNNNQHNYIQCNYNYQLHHPQLNSSYLMKNDNKLILSNSQQQQQNARVSWDDSRSPNHYYKEFNGENNDIVAIKIRQPRGKSLESLEDINERNTRTHLTFSHYSTDYTYFPQHMQMHPVHQKQLQQQQLLLHAQQHQQQQQQPVGINKHLCMNTSLPYHVGSLQWRRSYDDGDITPTNEIATDLNEVGGTLPRQRTGNNSSRCRLLDSNCTNPIPSNLASRGSCCSGGNGGSNTTLQQTHHLNSNCDYNNSLSQQDNVVLMANAVRYSGSPLASKKIAPEPPRRQCSVRQTGRNTRIPDTAIATVPNPTVQQLQYYMQQQQQQQQQNLIATRNSQQYAQHIHQQQQQQQQQPIYVNYSTVHQTTAEIHCDRTHDSKSNSSIDSIDTIPFANENTGTIKQRLLNRQEISSTLSLSSSSSSSSSTNTVANIAQSSLQSTGLLHEQPTTLHNISGGPSGSNNHTTTNNSSGTQNDSSNSSCCGSNISNSPPSPTLSYQIHIESDNNSGNNSTYQNLHHDIEGMIFDDSTANTNTGACSTRSSMSVNIDGLHHHHQHHDIHSIGSINLNGSNDLKIINNDLDNTTPDSVNVLNDIGNMLANLTDELDAMLEEEKRVGISDSE